jgi:hypothetical protein
VRVRHQPQCLAHRGSAVETATPRLVEVLIPAGRSCLSTAIRASHTYAVC